MHHTPRQHSSSARGALAAAAVLALAALAAPLAAGADQPLLPIGTLPGGVSAAPASAAVSPAGQGNACVSSTGLAVDPSASAATGLVQTGDCSSGAAAGGGSTSGSGNGASGTGSTVANNLIPAAANVSGAKAAVLSAGDASQLQISAVRFATKGVRSARKLGLVVTVRGQEGRPVQNGAVAINNLPMAKINCLCQRATFTNGLGQASFTIPVTNSMLGKRLFFQVSARTPTLKSSKLVSVQIP